MTVRISDREPETLLTPGNTFLVLDDGDSTERQLGMVECVLDPGWPGPPQHVHREHDEMFYVLEGRVRYSSGDREFVAEVGDVVTVSRGEPHTFGNAEADRPARLLGACSPSRFIDFFRAMATAPKGADGRIGRDVMFALMDAFASHPYVPTAAAARVA